MKTAVQTLLLPGTTLEEKFNAAAQFGFDAVEVAVGPDFDIREHLNDVEQAVRSSGLPVCALCTHPIHDPLHPDPQAQSTRLAALAELLALADAIGARGVVSVPVRPPITFSDVPWAERYSVLRTRFLEALADWVSALPSGNSALFLEPLNRYEAYFLTKVSQAVDLSRTLNHPRVQALADLFHMNIEEADLGQPLLEAGSWLGHVHVADNNRYEPGAGCMPIKSALRALKAANYQGYLSIECWSPDGPKLSGAAEVTLPRSVSYLRQEWEEA